MLKKSQWVEIMRMPAEGFSKRAMARRLGIDRRTVASALSKSSFPVKPASGHKSTVEPYRALVVDYLAQNPRLGAMGVYKRLQEQGFGGGYNAVKRFVR